MYIVAMKAEIKYITYILWILTLSYSCEGSPVRIVNGNDASPGLFPYAVSVRYFENHECGGSIIGDKWILTAAHCIYLDYVNVLTILYGSINLRNGESPEGNTAKVENAYMHEDYVPSGGYENDIGLLQLAEFLQFNVYVQPINLPTFETKIPLETAATLVGWGYPQYDVLEVMEVLQYVTITIFSDDICARYHRDNYSTSSHICAGVIGGGKGQCTGDSGGPLVINNTQYGIVSWSDRPCTTTPGVLTRVTTFRQWIYENSGI